MNNMFTSQFSRTFNFFTIVATLFLLTNHYCFCLNFKPINDSLGSNGFSQAVATWYGDTTGGGTGGACGFENDVNTVTYNGLTAAGSQFLFKSGKGCGACYQVRCTQNPFCSGYPVMVTITNACLGSSNNEPVHFDLSGKAFGYLAKRGQGSNLRNAGLINIQYQSVPCHYDARITFKIDSGSNRNYLAFVIEYVQGDGDIGAVEIFPSNRGSFQMQQSFGATWKVELPEGVSGPFSVKVTTIERRTSFFAKNAIPADWAPGQYYHG